MEIGAAADAPTAQWPGASPEPEERPPSGGDSRPSAHGRFLPGQVLNKRYRIVALLGRGGMGEVYRADDLTLGQAVALKFLPPKVSDDPERLERFRSEARSARQVAHPNVCRVYDIGDAEGESFLSMEYVEGEDLALLLRRIGRLPEDKALQISRQIAAGLAAAHDRGLVHRDLKPANVMLDERGTARITDFGLAATIHGEGAGGFEGTPGYMAPEQLRGEAASTASDLYAFGLLMFELFTGKRVWEASSLQERLRLRRESATSSLTDSMETLAPAIARIILRCLEEDPERRPGSALAVSAALPGGDPLAAALAAGETPSPELVAAAGGEDLTPVPWLFGALLVVGVVAAGLPALGAWMGWGVRTELPYSPEVMRTKARETLARLGYGEPPTDRVGSYAVADTETRRRVATETAGPDRGPRPATARPPLVRYWYREGPRALVNTDYFSFPNKVGGMVTYRYPPHTTPGMVRAIFDPAGRLWALEALPPERWAGAVPHTFDWQPLLAEAGLAEAKLTPVSPEWTPPFAVHHRAAWTGRFPQDESVEIRVEAGSFGERPAYLRLILPWTEPFDGKRGSETVQVAVAAAFTALLLSILVAGGWLARRNLRVGRGDRQGANRLATILFAMLVVEWAVTADHVSSFSELGLLFIGLSWSLFFAGVLWLLYMALEPWLRRRGPEMLIGWSRALRGRLTDPRVGRDLLVGVAAGLAVGLIAPVAHGLATASGGSGIHSAALAPLLGGPLDSVALILTYPVTAIVVAFLLAYLLFVFRVLLRSDVLAFLGLVGFLALPGLGTADLWVVLATSFAIAAVITLVLFRFGLLSLAAFGLASNLAARLAEHPSGLGEWTGGSILVIWGVLAALAIWAFRTALAGRPLVSAAALEI